MRKDKKIYALGFFDGVHLGHQALLVRCVLLAKEMGCSAAAITFDRHPQSLFAAEAPTLITTADLRHSLLHHFGMDHVQVLPVTKEVMSQHWRFFLEQLIADGAVGFVCGDDFHFGHKGEGNAEKLQQFCAAQNLPCIIVPEQTLDGVRVSSTHIRALIEQGDMGEASRFLGHPHILSGEVVSGRQLGRTMGVPTANIAVPAGVICPKRGVYACKAIVDGQEYRSVTNIGSRPTVGGHQVRAESWLLDFDGDLYGKHIMLLICKFLRPERKFDSLEELKAQIQLDAAQTRKFLG